MARRKTTRDPSGIRQPKRPFRRACLMIKNHARWLHSNGAKSCCIRKALFTDCDVFLPASTLAEWLRDADNKTMVQHDVGHDHDHDGDGDAVGVGDGDAALDADADAAHVRASKESVDAAKNMKDDTAGMHEDSNTFQGFIDGLREHLED